MELTTRFRSVARSHWSSRRRQLALFVVGLVMATSSAAGALYSATTSQSDTFAAGFISPASGFSAHSVTANSAQLVWTPPANFIPTNWTITQTTPTGSVSGSCAGSEPASGCSVTGLSPGTTYTWTISYFDGGWGAVASTSATPTSVSSSTQGTYTLSVPAHVTSFTFSLEGAGGGGGGGTGGIGGTSGTSATGTVTLPSSNSVTYFTVVVGGGGGPGDSLNGGSAGIGGTGCAGGTAGAAGGANNGGGGGGGAMTCLYLQGAPATSIVAVAGGNGGDGGGTDGPGTGGAGGRPTSTSGTVTYVVNLGTQSSNGGAGGGPGIGGASGSVVFGGNGLSLT